MLLVRTWHTQQIMRDCGPASIYKSQHRCHLYHLIPNGLSKKQRIQPRPSECYAATPKPTISLRFGQIRAETPSLSITRQGKQEGTALQRMSEALWGFQTLQASYSAQIQARAILYSLSFTIEEYNSMCCSVKTLSSELCQKIQ